MVKLPGITEELKRRPVFDVNSLLGEAENHTEERLKTRVEVPHDAVGTGSSHFSPSRGDVDHQDSQSPKPQRTHDHESVAEDAINPAHYRRHPSGIECIEVTRHMNFNVGNAIKYLWRYMDKGDPVENLKKAQWYIDDEIRRLEGKR
jgi:hypothetical protein